MPDLRGHHLICLHFYSGEGYDDAFIRNLQLVLERAGKEGVRICPGADDVCALCPYRQEDRCTFSRAADREIRQMDDRALALLGLEAGLEVTWKALHERAVALFPRWYETSCFACTWRPVCEKNDLFQRLKSKAEESRP